MADDYAFSTPVPPNRFEGPVVKDKVSRKVHVTPPPVNKLSDEPGTKYKASRKKHVTPPPVNRY